MEIGLVLTGGTLAADVELARRAERAGLDAVFAIEFFDRNAYAALGALAAATSRVRVGTAIANAFTRSPLLHASAALDADALSGGRVILGLGSATRRMNVEWFGVPFDAPAPRMRELVRLLRAAFAAKEGGGLRFEGRFWNLNVPLYAHAGAPRSEIPIWVAAVNRGMIAAAGACADALVGHPIATRRWHREVTLPGLRAAEERAGRPAGACALAPYVLTSLCEDRGRAVAEAKRQIGFYFTTRLYHSVLEHHGLREVGEACREALRSLDLRAMEAAVPDELVDALAIAGPPDEARDRLAEWKELTDFPLLYAPTVGVAPERVRENLDAMLERFGRSARGAAEGA